MGRKRRIPRGGFVPRAMEYTQVSTDGTVTMKARMDGPSSPLATFTLGMLDNPSREEIGRHDAIEEGTRRLGSAFLVAKFESLRKAQRGIQLAKSMKIRAGYVACDRMLDRSSMVYVWITHQCADHLMTFLHSCEASQYWEGTMPDPSSGTSQHLCDTHVYRKPKSRTKLGTSPRPERGAEMKAWQEWQRTGLPHVARGGNVEDDRETAKIG